MIGRFLFSALVLGCLLGLVTTLPAQAQGPLRAGTTVERMLRIDGKRVALPMGAWVVAADGPSEWNDSSIGAYGYLRTIILFRIVDGRIDAVLEVNANVLPTMDGWGMAAACARNDLILAVIRYRAGWDGSCYFVTHTMMARETTPIWRRARDYAAQNRVTVPRIMLTAGFRSANRTDVLDIRYHFAGETRGVGSDSADRWKDSAWMAHRLEQDQRRNSFARAVSDWAVGYSGAVDAGLKNRSLSDDPVAMPDVERSNATIDVVSRRLAQLQLLRQGGAISAEEYEAQAKALREHGLGASSNAPDLATVTAVKALSYRIIVSISHIFVDYYWTGNYVATGALEVLQITINSAKFYLHELGWARYHGVPRTDAARVIDFKYIGVDI
ncbi:MAG: DUF2061 domain-containing protein [Acetobacteraceae bacterium]